MYQTRVVGDRLFHSRSDGYGESIELFGEVQDGDTPMSLVTIALGACVTMCTQDYLNRHHGLDGVDITTETTFDQNQFLLTVGLPSTIFSQLNLEALSQFVHRFCKVKKVLRDDLTISVTFKESI